MWGRVSPAPSGLVLRRARVGPGVVCRGIRMRLAGEFGIMLAGANRFSGILNCLAVILVLADDGKPGTVHPTGGKLSGELQAEAILDFFRSCCRDANHPKLNPTRF